MSTNGQNNRQAMGGCLVTENKQTPALTTVPVMGEGPIKAVGITGTPVKKVRQKYVPPHMRKKLQQERQRMANQNNNMTPPSQTMQGSNDQQYSNNQQSPQWSGGSQDLREARPRRSYGNQAPNIMIPSNGSPTHKGGNGNSHFRNRFSKNNLYDRDVRNSGRGGYNDDRNSGGYRSPNTYNPARRQGYGSGHMRRQRSSEYIPNRRFNGRDRDRSQKADPDLERELFGAKVAQGINFDIYDKIPVEVSGQTCPKPIDSFDEIDLPPQIAENIKLVGFSKPTPVQRYSIPAGIKARDLMSCAQTGSGKTAAFLVPIIARLILEGRAEEVLNKPQQNFSYGKRQRYQVHSLVLSPTRELAQQIHKQARKFLYRTGLRSVVVYGGADIRDQLRELNKGCEVLVATPGRLVDFLERGRLSLAKALCLCMDEADRMLDMGFEPQIRQIVDRYDMPKSHQGRQTMMFSATFPRVIQVLAQDYLNDYIFLAVGRVGSSTDLIEQKLQYCQNHNKVEALMDVLPDCHGLTLIFVATRRDADRIEHILCEEGVNARSIHGDRTQWEREAALNDFRTGTCPVLVATDVAARGLDIPSVMWVINYDLPNQIDAYVHRIGRTGRCGNRGNALSFVNESNKPVLRDLLHTLRECDMTCPQWFVNMVNNSTYGGSGRGSKKKSKFGARDARRGNNRGGNGFGGNRGGYQNRGNKGGGGGGYSNRRGNNSGGGGFTRNDYHTRRSNSNDAW